LGKRADSLKNKKAAGNATEGFNQSLFHDVQYPYERICFGIDQSYTSTGIAVAAKHHNKNDYDILICFSFPNTFGTKVEYRLNLCKQLNAIVKKYISLGKQSYALCEVVRVYSGGVQLMQNHVAWGALIGCMADMLYDKHDMALRVVDTRKWKAAIVGTCKPSDSAPRGVDKNKWPTIQCMMHKYDISRNWLKKKMSDKSRSWTWEESYPNFDKNIKYTYDDNIADACAIALYGVMYKINELQFAP